jgi:hypothetical protein
MPFLGEREEGARSRRVDDTDGILSTHDRPRPPPIRQILPSDRQILPAIQRETGAVQKPIRAKPLSSGEKVNDEEQDAPAAKRKRHAVLQ